MSTSTPIPIPDWAVEAAYEVLMTPAGTVAEAATQIARHHQRATQTLTCIACGHEYPPGTPASQHEALLAHIRVCAKHPMREVEAKLDGIRTLCGESARALGQIKDLANVNQHTRQMLVRIGNALNAASR